MHAAIPCTAVSAYLQTPRHRVYEVLKRWAEEGHAGLDDRPTSAPRSPARKVTMNAITEVRKSVRESPELGAYRVRAALEQIGIHLSQATCGRLLALNRKLYGVPKPSGGAPRARREMPFKAHFKHEIWSVDVRYIESHLNIVRKWFLAFSELEVLRRTGLSKNSRHGLGVRGFT